MSFRSELNVCEAVMSREIITKSNFVESESECAAVSKRESIAKSLVKNWITSVKIDRYHS